ncbi:MAG: hypothetical protein EU532_01520 [Promethearchaeota archaeon]|nr:MAG: hypothetical protein EU532_01520 [Candidatus Lokiarchaeota archaeon]
MNCTYFFKELYNSLIYYGHHKEWKEFAFKFGFKSDKTGSVRLSDAILETVMELQEFRDQLTKIIFECLGHGIKFKILERGILSIWIE